MRRMPEPHGPPYDWSQYNTYGLAPQFLNSLCVPPPLNNRCFVANLDFKVGGIFSVFVLISIVLFASCV